MSEDASPLLTAIDQIANGEQLQIMKATLPYLEKSSQRTMAIYIKAMEINNILSFFNAANDVQACTLEPEHTSPMDILQDIRNFCKTPMRDAIDQCINMYQMTTMMKTMTEASGGDSDMLMNLLSPEQQSMFDTFQSMTDPP